MKMEDALQLYINLILNKLPPFGFVAKVIKVNSDNTVDVERSLDDVVFAAKLTPVEGGASFIIRPKINSYVFCVSEDNTDTDVLVVAFSSIERYELKSDLIEFNGGLNAGLILLKELTERLNLIEGKLNEVIGSYKAHNHLHPQGVTTGFVAPFLGAKLNKTKSADIENTKIMQ